MRANDAVNGVVTDIDGKYLIQVSDAAKSLVFSYIGYQAKDEPINGRNVINVTMREDNKLLDEVVVVGYGTMQRKDVTSSITTVKAEDLNIGAYTDPAQLLQGKVPGLSIVQSSDPNAGTTSVTLRGASTLNSSTAPLYVVDGIPGVDLSLISPDDIESIDVLRDASATAIYGSKAANGVIIVTTKKGSQETQNVTYSAYVSWEKIMKHLDVMSADEMRAYAKANNITLDDDQGADTNWADVVSRTGFAHNHNLAISGGKGSTAYTASVNYMERDGVIKNTGMDRVIARAMVNGSVLKDHLTFTLGVNGSISNHWGVPTGINGGTGVNGGTSVFDAMYYYSPLVPVTNADGSWFNNSSYVSQSYNPMSLINEHQSKTTNKRLQLLGKVSLKIIDGLLLNANFAIKTKTGSIRSISPLSRSLTSATAPQAATHQRASPRIWRSMPTMTRHSTTCTSSRSWPATHGSSRITATDSALPHTISTTTTCSGTTSVWATARIRTASGPIPSPHCA